MTVLELLKSSLRLIGAIASGETPNAQSSTDALEVLNLLLQEWLNSPLLAYTEQQNFSVVSGTYSYSIGPSQTWDGNKPLKVTKAFLRDSDGYDHKLNLIGEDEYMELYDKDAEARPTKLFYKPSNTTGTVYLYGKPDDAYTIYLKGPRAFTEYTSLSTTINLPTGYLSALRYNLAVELSPEYEKDPAQWIVKRANDTIAAIKRTNLPSPREIKIDNMFTGPGNYNIDSDTWE